MLGRLGTCQQKASRLLAEVGGTWGGAEGRGLRPKSGG